MFDWIKDLKSENLREDYKSIKLFLLLFMPFFLINVLSLLWTWNTLDTLKEINILIWVICIVYLFCIIKNKENALKAIVIASAVISICAIVQSKVLFPKLIETFKGERYGDMVMAQSIPFASFLYHNVFGGYMCFVLPLSIYFGIYLKKRLFNITTIFIIAGLIHSTSRIAMAVSGLFLIVSVCFMLKEKNIKGILNLLLIVSISILLVIVLLMTDLSGLTSELTKKAQATKSEIKTLNARTEIWQNSFNAFMAKPIIGFGAGTSEFAYRKYFDGGIYTKYTHNFFLKILIETGILGFLCFLIYLIGFLYYLKGKLRYPTYFFVFISILSGLLFGIVDFSFDMPAHTITFFILSSIFFKNENKTVFFKNKFSKKIASIFIIAVLLVSFIFTTKVCLAKKSIENANALQENGFFVDAFNYYKEAINEMPLDNEGYIGIVSILRRQYQIETNIKEKTYIENLIIHKLKLMEKRPGIDSQIYFVTGLCYETLGIDIKAEEYLLKALSYFPSSALYLSEIIRFYLIRNEFDKASLWIQSAEKYFERYRVSKNPVGFYVFKIKDMQAQIEFIKGNKINALSILKDNLHDILADKYLIFNIKTGLNISKIQLIKYFEERLQEIEKKVGNG
ncbi:MAG: O-antigen ligase family protein [Candidatus Goldbacteria bacterium]|nr:O-antigen ligase family protein [Candidatus Goldiibacteriota bacterium]